MPNQQRLSQSNPVLALVASLAATLGLWGCQTVPVSVPAPSPVVAPVVSGVLSPAQVTGLQGMGFTEDAQGWTFNLSEGKLLFDTGDDSLNASGRRLVADLARGLLGIDLTRLRVEGHTDNVGGQEFNKALSQRRSDFVAKQFVLNGFQDKNMTRVGFGLSKPIANNATPEGRAQNRRVSLIVVVE